MSRKHLLNEDEGRFLDAAVERVDVAKLGVEQARRELGAVMRTLGFSASADYLDRSRQWAMSLAKLAEDVDPRDDERGRWALADSLRRFGVLEPITAELVDDQYLRVVDGHRRLRAAREAGISSFPVTVLLRSSTDAEPRSRIVDEARAAAAEHRLVRFAYQKLHGEPMVRTVDVWEVLNRSGRWYLVGYDRDRKDVRVFRLARVQDAIEDVGPGSPPPEGFSGGAHLWGPLDPESMEDIEARMSSVEAEGRWAGRSSGRPVAEHFLDQLLDMRAEPEIDAEDDREVRQP